MSKTYKKRKPFKGTKQMRQEVEQLETVWSRESEITTRMLLWICERIENGLLGPKPNHHKQRVKP